MLRSMVLVQLILVYHDLTYLMGISCDFQGIVDEIRKITSPSVVREIYPILDEIEPEAKRQSAIISKEWIIRVQNVYL